ncbi:hypothetical protein [Sinorhizobium medicae]|uniref:hypothetical protein n=1 Tax=Sinorhizobium medicae TaxID=110321 RepID=UPI000462D020|nr:hypothetical protein [Sinorhizobium medicae]RVQ76135.1 ASCH domain-containing protein [Sinorhizobium medicae]
MVAYDFKRFFEPQIATGFKRQTVCGQRRRHARPGEAVQLYLGMRTRFCRKIVDPDPLCSRILPVVIETSTLLDCVIAAIEIDGRRLHRDEIEEFASADGFAPERINGVAIDMHGKTARENMGAFWRAHHPPGLFEGVLVEWSPTPPAPVRQAREG